LTEAATKKLADFTGNNAGAVLAVIIDNQIVSAPRIREAITSGDLQITGDFDLETLSNLGVVMRSGPLAAPLWADHRIERVDRRCAVYGAVLWPAWCDFGDCTRR
uniref:Lipid kinase n=1 Tax=Parastrongyloides trichosuri TaxID=131310 RepID=A0A0N4ZII9_PARTI